MITITVLGLEDDLCRAVLRRVAAVVVESDAGLSLKHTPISSR